MTTLTDNQRATARRALIAHGVRTTGMTDSQLWEAYARIDGATFEPALIKAKVLANTAPATAPVAPLEQLQAALAALLPAAPVDEGKVIELIKAHGQKPAKLVVESRLNGAPVSAIVNTPHPLLEKLVRLAAIRRNVYLVGPAGSGKTTLASQCAQALALPFYFTGAILQKYELLGFIDAAGAYQRTPFRDAFEHGGVFLQDEIDASSPAALVAFNQAVANKECAFPDGIVKAHPDFVVVAAANTTGKGATRQYIGRNALDGATLDRYVMLEVSYCVELENKLARAEYLKCGGDESGFSVVDHLTISVQNMRDRAAAKQWQTIISPRQSIDGAAMLAAGFDLREVLEILVYSKFTTDQRSALGV